MFALEEYCKEREKLKSESDESCTSKPCKWNVPRKRNGNVVPIADMQFTKHDYAKKKVKGLSQLLLDFTHRNTTTFSSIHISTSCSTTIIILQIRR
jgi:hypothetical protein